MSQIFKSELMDVLSKLLAIMFWSMEYISMWHILKKASEKGWKYLIPFYNQFVVYKIFWQKQFYLIWLPLKLTQLTCLAVIYLNLFQIEQHLIFLSFAFGLVASSILLLILYIVKEDKISKAFGKGGFFSAGLIFLNTIFLPILAFGKAKYKKSYKKEHTF